MSIPLYFGQIGASCSRRLASLGFTYHTLYDQYVHYVPVAQRLPGNGQKYISSFSNCCDLVITPSGDQKMIQNKDKTPLRLSTGVETRKFEKVIPRPGEVQHSPSARSACLWGGCLERT